jgi:hypothetical protein
MALFLVRFWGKVLLALGTIEDDPIPAVLAYQGAINGEQNLLPGAQLLATVRAGIIDPAIFRICDILIVAFVGQFPTPVLK